MSDEVTCHDCGLEYYGPAGHKCLGFNLGDMLERLEALEAAPRLVMLYALMTVVDDGRSPLQRKRVAVYHSEKGANADLAHIEVNKPHKGAIVFSAEVIPILAVEHGEVVQIVQLGEPIEKVL